MRINGRLSRLLGLMLALNACSRDAADAQQGPEGQIAFYSLRNGRADIYVVNADGSDPRRLTDGSAGGKCPAFSPDGGTIAFQRGDGGNEDIYLMNADGTGVRRLTESPANERHAAWSPDGSRIAFQSDRDGNRDIYIMAADGSDWLRVTDDPARDMWPSWSPDGGQIAFNSYRDGNWEIYIINADGTDERRVTSSERWELFPAWSPDGERIAFRSGRAEIFEGDIHTIAPDGTDEQKLTDAEGMEEDPAWSPDGRYIAFQSMRSGNFEIYIIDRDGGEWHNVTRHPAHDYWPKWGRAARATPSVAPQQPSDAASDVEIRVVYDDRTSRDDLEPHAGFSALVRLGESTLLFDAGADGQVLLSNMAQSSIDPAEIDQIVISHNHSDHVGGLLEVLGRTNRPEVFLPAHLPDNLSPPARRWVAATIDSAKQRASRVVEVVAPLRITHGVHTTGEMGTRIPEQALMLQTDAGVIVLTGCAHPGVIELVKEAKELTGAEVLLVMGGFHLDGRDAEDIREVVSELSRLTRFISPCHCSGDEAKELFQSVFGDRHIECGAGRIVRGSQLTRALDQEG